MYVLSEVEHSRKSMLHPEHFFILLVRAVIKNGWPDIAVAGFGLDVHELLEVCDWTSDGNVIWGIIEDSSETNGVVTVAEREGISGCDVFVLTLMVPTFCAVEQS